MMKFARSTKKKPSGGGGGADPPPSSSSSSSGAPGAATAASGSGTGSGSSSSHNRVGVSSSSSGGVGGGGGSSGIGIGHHTSKSQVAASSSSGTSAMATATTSSSTSRYRQQHSQQQQQQQQQQQRRSTDRASTSAPRSSSSRSHPRISTSSSSSSAHHHHHHHHHHQPNHYSDRHVNGSTSAPPATSSSSSHHRQQQQQQQQHEQQQQQQQRGHEKPPPSATTTSPSSTTGGGGGGRLGVAGSLGSAITSSLGSLTMHARGGSGGGGGGGATGGSSGGGAAAGGGGILSRGDRSSSNNNDGGGGGGGGRHASSHHSQSSQQPQHVSSQQQHHHPSQPQHPQQPLTRRRESNSSSTRYKSSAQSVVSIGSTSVFSPSIIGTSTRSGNGGGGGGGGGQNELQPSSARLLRDLNKSAQSSLLSSLGTAAASRTFRSYKMMLPRYVPRMTMMTGLDGGSNVGASGSCGGDGEENHGGAASTTPLETDLELLGRTVHAVSSALTEPPRVGDRYMIYDVSFNPRGCVWDASVVVYDDDDEEEEGEDGGAMEDKDGIDRSTTSRTSRTGGGSSAHLTKTKKGGGSGSGTFTFPIRVTCAEDEDDDFEDDHVEGEQDGGAGGTARPRAKTYAVELSVIDDSVHHLRNAADHRDNVKNSVEWISYGIRRSMARSMFPQFPEGCRGRPFREIYQLNKKIKSGTFSTVCRGVHRVTGRQVAVKCILRKKIEPSVDAAVFEEVLIMSGLHHKYICPMIDYFEEDRCHFVVMELERGGDLCERLNEKGTYSEDEARQVIRNMCEAMDFVHSRGFAHCDIKPRNYLLRSKRDDLDIRLADFGFAQHVHAPNSLTSQCGTPFFVAPEVINRKPYDQKVDMWSIGVTTYLLLSGDTPFNGKNRQQLFRRISCDDPPFPDEKWDKISYEALDFVRKLLEKDPAKRLSAKQALSHLWLRMNENGKTTAPEQSHQKAPTAQTGGVTESIAEVSSRKSGGTSGKEQSGEPKSPRSPTSGSSANRHGNESAPSPPFKEPAIQSSRSGSSDRAKSRTERRTSSREQTTTATSRGVPPPPPKPQPQAPKSASATSIASRSDRGGSAVANQILHNFGNSADDVNARLLDVIKDQDAKIEKLERLVKQMLEPEGAKHER